MFVWAKWKVRDEAALASNSRYISHANTLTSLRARFTTFDSMYLGFMTRQCGQAFVHFAERHTLSNRKSVYVTIFSRIFLWHHRISTGIFWAMGTIAVTIDTLHKIGTLIFTKRFLEKLNIYKKKVLICGSSRKYSRDVHIWVFKPFFF